MVSKRSSSPATVFLDTSVLFAAAYSASGSARDLLQLGSAGIVTLFVSSFVVLEVERNLAAKAPGGVPALRTYLTNALVVTDPSAALIEEAAMIIELKDAPFVAGAVAASTDCLATYDRKHLLAQAAAIKLRFNVAVLTPEQILVEILSN